MNAVPWWKKTVVYQIYPRSFLDSNEDGVGDLRGIISKLDYLKDLGVETLWISPFYASPQADFGYDISDYRCISPEFGDMDTCLELIREVHIRGMYIVFDMVLNHTSDRHPWFLESRSSRDHPKRDWYIWRDGRKPGGKRPPNNWHSMIGGSGWHYDAGTDQWYWAQFLPFQPDLNYRNPAVRKEMLDTMRFWLDRGVDGFRLDIVNALFEDEALRDNPFAWKLFPSDEDPTMLFQQSTHTLNHPDTLEFMKELRKVVDGCDAPPRFLVGEVSAAIDLVRAHCGEGGNGLNLAFLFRSLATPLDAEPMRRLIKEYEAWFPEPLSPTWVFGNHDRARRVLRLKDDLELAKLNVAWQLTVRGVPFLYYGEEIGQPQARFPVRDSLDAVAIRMKSWPQWVFDFVRWWKKESINRDECRTPMQWEPGVTAGFCPPDVRPWLPVPREPVGRSVSQQREDPDSLWNTCRRFLHVRKEYPSLNQGTLELLPATKTGPSVVGYVRRSSFSPGMLVLLNPSRQQQSVRLAGLVRACTPLISTRPVASVPGDETLVLEPLEGWVGFIDETPASA